MVVGSLERGGGRDGGGNVHAYAAIGVPGISEKFGGTDFVRGSISIRRQFHQ
jgi:hypothetical protein